MTIVLSEGVHAIGEQATFKPENRTFSRTDRLTIRAEILPDDPSWDSGRMPALIHTLPLKDHWNGRPLPPGTGATSYGIEIETSHATIRGLKVLARRLSKRRDHACSTGSIPSGGLGARWTTLRSPSVCWRAIK